MPVADTLLALAGSAPATAYWLALGLCALGAILALLLPGERLAYRTAAWLTALAGVGALIAGIGALGGFGTPAADIPSALPFGPLLIRLDALGAYFLILLGLLATPIAIFSIGPLTARPSQQADAGSDEATSAMRTEHGSLRAYGLLLCLLVLSLFLIVSAGDAVLFIIAWEAMAFLSYLFAIYHDTDRQAARASFVMLAVSEGGTALVIAAFLFLYRATGSFAFVDMRQAALSQPIALCSAIFALTLVGFGAKAGILPFQFWQTRAYPATNGAFAALLSAMVMKMAFYGLFRFDFNLLGGGPTWWGLVALGVGVLTALGGVLYSLVQDDLKRVLAYSSVEHAGILLAGLGAALTFQSVGLTALAAIAAMAALYHALNHATFKGLLFLGSSAVEHGAGTSRLERLGGLARRAPLVGACFLVGALAISAVPPFNGYVSEWMLLETLLQSFAAHSALVRLCMAVAGATLALVAGIGVTAFVRAFGVPFLGLARSAEAEKPRPATLSMRLALAWLAFLCLGLGIAAPLVLAATDRVTTELVGVSVINQVVPPLFTGRPGAYAPLVGLGGGLFGGLIPGNGLVIIAAPDFSTIDSPTYLFLAELLLLALIWIVRRAIQPLGVTRRAPVWAGGIPRFTARMAYSGVAYSNPLRLIFNLVYRSRATTELVEPAARHRRGHITYQQEVPEPFEREVYGPLRRAVHGFATRIKVIQSGDINQYLAYIFGIVLLILLLHAL